MAVVQRTVLLTGAAGGDGAATARRLARHAARLVLVDIQADALEALGAELGGSAITSVADVTDSAAMEQAVAEAGVRFDGIDVVVANAAIDAIGSVREIEPAAFDRVVEVNSSERRSRRAVIPRSNAPAVWAPKLFQRVAERWIDT